MKKSGLPIRFSEPKKQKNATQAEVRRERKRVGRTSIF